MSRLKCLLLFSNLFTKSYLEACDCVNCGGSGGAARMNRLSRAFAIVDVIYFSGIKWRKVYSIAECKLKVFFMTNKEVLSSIIHCTCNMVWAGTRETSSSGFPTSNKAAKLQRLARTLKFRLWQLWM